MKQRTGFSLVLLLKIAVLLMQSAALVSAWGADGHRITCHIAEPLLTPTAAEAVKSLLPDYANGSLANLCSWPDEIRWMWKWQWTSPLHYIDTPDFLCNYNYDRDCHNEKLEKDMCVSGAINNYSSQLLDYHAHSSNATTTVEASKQKTSNNLTEALLFLAHYVGDIHQPLHVGFTGDGGGNTISVHWYTRKYNLHHVWDSEFIFRSRDQFYGGNVTALTDAIYLNVTTKWTKESLEWAKCPDGDGGPCPDLYASESIRLACLWAYRNATPGTTLQDEYFLSRWPIVEKRLAQGGVRLANLLNHLFSFKSFPL